MLASASAREVALSRVTLPALAVEGVFDAAVSTFDGLNYLDSGRAPADARRGRAAASPGGWLVFDLHTDAMMAFTVANPVSPASRPGTTS